MATILKISDSDNVLEVMPISRGTIEMWIGNEEDPQSWRHIELDRDDATDLIEFIKKQLQSEK